MFFPRAPYPQEWLSAFSEIFVVAYLLGFASAVKLKRLRKITFVLLVLGFFHLVKDAFLPHSWVGKEGETGHFSSFPSVSVGLKQEGKFVFGDDGADFIASKGDCRTSLAPYLLRSGGLFLCSKDPFNDEADLGGDVDEAKLTWVLKEGIKLNIALLNLSAPVATDEFLRARITFRRLATLTRHSNESWLIITTPFSSPAGRNYGSFVGNLRVADLLVGTGFRINWLSPMLSYKQSPFGVFGKRINLQLLTN